jgi:hypothetical protein
MFIIPFYAIPQRKPRSGQPVGSHARLQLKNDLSRASKSDAEKMSTYQLSRNFPCGELTR